MKKALLTLVFSLWASSAFAAFAAVQTSSQNTGTGSSVAITMSATGQYNLVVVHVTIAATSESLSSVTDDKGNTYAILGPSDNGARGYMAYGVQTTGGVTTVTCNFSASTQAKRVGADEYSGGAVSNGAVFDKSASATGTSAAPSVSLSPTISGFLVVGRVSQSPTSSWTAGSGYTLYNGVNPVSTRSEYKLSGTTSETVSFSSTQSTGWMLIAASFKPKQNGGGFFAASN